MIANFLFCLEGKVHCSPPLPPPGGQEIVSRDDCKFFILVGRKAHCSPPPPPPGGKGLVSRDDYKFLILVGRKSPLLPTTPSTWVGARDSLTRLLQIFNSGWKEKSTALHNPLHLVGKEIVSRDDYKFIFLVGRKS
jgi:hypothetical protein